MLFSIALTTNKKTEDCLHINAFLLEYVNFSDYISKEGFINIILVNSALGSVLPIFVFDPFPL